MNDKAIVEDMKASFDLVVLQANLAISARRSLSSWLALDCPFWIDPITYAFAANTTYLKSEQKVRRGAKETRVDFKRTFRNLAEAYGAPFTAVISEDRSLSPSDFAEEADADLVSRVVEWQQTILEPSASDRRFFPEEAQAALLEPALLTVPYFPLQLGRANEDPPWMKVNLRLADAAAALYDLERLAVGLLIEDSLFDDDDALWPVVDRYGGVAARHIWLWISDNDEVLMSLPRAQRLRRLVAELTANGHVVHQAFGGTFSALLLHEDLASVGYGVGYWEHKSWEPLAGGGLPSLRFFYPPLGQRLRFLDAAAVNDAEIADAEEFHSRVCDCSTCRNTLRGDLANFADYGLVSVRSRTDRHGNVIEYDVPVPSSLRKTKEHYLGARGTELRRAAEAGFDPLAFLDAATEGFKTQQVVDLRYLAKWRRAFE